MIDDYYYLYLVFNLCNMMTFIYISVCCRYQDYTAKIEGF